jgi:hypothetical protein
MHIIKRGFIGAALLAALSACGGGGDFNGGGASTGGSTSSSAVRLGSGSEASFANGVLELSSKSISAGGSATVTATLVDATGTLFTTSTDITFNSPCVSSGLATIAGAGGTSSTVTATSGTAIATYTAKGCKGDDTITATATVNNVKLSASATLDVASAELGSIQFVSATPATITIKDMGGAGLQQTSTLIFAVKDAVGGPVTGADVKLNLVSDTGGVVLSQTEATSDANGDVSTIVTAGTHAGPVVVQASIVVNGKTISTSSSGLSIQGGIPSQTFFSLSIDTFNPEGFDIDGNIANITVRMADRFGNDVPNGTAVNFTESDSGFGAGGAVTPSCLTTSGHCQSVWTSQSPRPTTVKNKQHVGFAYFLAFATGEEGFNDENGDGVFDDYRTTVGGSLTPEPFDDIGEIYAASAEFAPCTLPVTSTDPAPCSDYRNGENFYDFNNDGVRNGPDGKWEGVNCQETLSGKCGSASTTGVGTYGCIVMSGSFASFSSILADNVSVSASGGSATLLAAPSTISAAIADENFNVLPKGTKITVDQSSLTGATATISPASSGTFTVGDTGCADSIANWPARFLILLTPTTGTISGSVGILVTTPSDAVSELVITFP